VLAVDLLLTDLLIFDGEGPDLFRGEVRLSGRRIASVARGGERLDRHDARVIDGAGMTLMPGMVEAHAHLTFPSSVDRIVLTSLPPAEQHQFIALHNARVLLDHGFTSAYSGGATRPAMEVALRDEIDGGWVPGPRIKASSFERGTSGLRDTWSPGVEQARRFAEEMIAIGVDSMKLIMDGRNPIDPSQWHRVNYGPSELDVISELTRAADVNLTAHAYLAESIRLCARFDFHAIYHCTFADQEAIDMIVAKKDRIFVAPCVGILMADAHERFPTREENEQTGAFRALDGQRRVIPELHRRGVRVLPGGDYGFPHNPHGRDARDLELFVSEFGFTPAEALRSATQYGGQLMRMGDELGLIRPGYLADLLLVDGDPLADIRILQDKERLRLIVKDGMVYKDTVAEARARRTVTAA
jgi:imidazolonepropionase-like amidohydrolase